MPRYSTAVPILDSEPRIPDVLDRSACAKHNAEFYNPCWTIWKLDGGKSPAVCNSRAKRAGFDAPISPASMGEGRIFGQS